MFLELMQIPASVFIQKKGTTMSKLQREIASNKTKLINADDKKVERKVLVDSLLDTVSGGWVNSFANWTKRF